MWKEAVVYVVAFIVALLAVWLLPLGFSRAGGAAVVAAAFLAAGLAQLAESVIPLWQIVLLVGVLLLAGSYLLDRWFGPLLYRSVETGEAGERRKGGWKGSGDRTAAGDRDGTIVQNAAENLVDSTWPAAFGQSSASRGFQGAGPSGEALRSHVQETGNTASEALPAQSEADSGEAERAPKSRQTAFLLRTMDGVEEAASDPGADQAEPEELLSLDSIDAEQKMCSVDRDDAEREELFPLDSERVELEKLPALDLDAVEPNAMTDDGGGLNVEPARRLRDWLDELPVSMTPDIEAAVLQALDLSLEEEDGQLSAFISSSSAGVSAVENGLPSGQAMPCEGALLEEAMPGIVDRSLPETDEAAEPPRQEDAMKAGRGRQEGQRVEHGWPEGEQSTERRDLEEEGQMESRREEESERPARMIGPDVVQAVALELRLNRRRLGAADYERCILRCLDAPLSDRDYYVLARLLMEHYVAEQQYGKLAAWLEELADRFRAYPAVAEELALWRQFAATLANSWGEQDES
ncbi:hypothetical protein [Geobacillus sp. TFV-3]|uniref:hypothetical protein n=1 Tax=Geobacillus sp. TFV-3 TaxID=1897059 RepID=UPI00135996DB|nr:hypothetical protein [Geobacillus sp. TFV-3]KAF0994288.1 hypothetical protein BJQ97_00930 [Geobacillus sp. TFV-3]